MGAQVCTYGYREKDYEPPYLFQLEYKKIYNKSYFIPFRLIETQIEIDEHIKCIQKAIQNEHYSYYENDRQQIHISILQREMDSLSYFEEQILNFIEKQQEIQCVKYLQIEIGYGLNFGDLINSQNAKYFLKAKLSNQKKIVCTSSQSTPKWFQILRFEEGGDQNNQVVKQVENLSFGTDDYVTISIGTEYQKQKDFWGQVILPIGLLRDNTVFCNLEKVSSEDKKEAYLWLRAQYMQNSLQQIEKLKLEVQEYRAALDDALKSVMNYQDPNIQNQILID